MAAEKKRAEKTSFIIGYIDNDGAPITDRKKMVKRRFAATSFSHDEDSEKQQSESLRGSDADVFGEDGFLWGSGGFEMEVPLQGSLHILRTLLRDAKPVSTPIPTKTLVAAKTDLETIDADNYFTDTTTDAIDIVDSGGVTLSGLELTRNFENNLSTYKGVGLLVTADPDKDAAAPARTDGTITITFKDAHEKTDSRTLTFLNAQLGDAQSVTLPADVTITRIQATGFNAGKVTLKAAVPRNVPRNPDPNRPGRIRVKATGAPADHTIRLYGERRVGLASDDTLPLVEEIPLGSDEITEKYFHKIEDVQFKDSTGTVVTTVPGTVEIVSEPGGYETTLKMSNELIRLMMEAEVGGIPRKITRGEFISGQLNISDTVRLTIDMLSKRVDRRATIEGGSTEKFIATAAEHPTEFPFVSEKFFPDWGGYLELDDEAFVFDSATVDINRNEDFSAGKRASRFRAALESGDRRNVTAQIQGSYISGTSEDDKFIRWDSRFRDNTPVKARIANYHWPTTGRQYSMEWIMNYCEVTSPVRVEASSPGNLPITINLKAVPDPTVAGASELTVKIVSDDQWTT